MSLSRSWEQTYFYIWMKRNVWGNLSVQLSLTLSPKSHITGWSTSLHFTTVMSYPLQQWYSFTETCLHLATVFGVGQGAEGGLLGLRDKLRVLLEHCMTHSPGHLRLPLAAFAVRHEECDVVGCLQQQVHECEHQASYPTPIRQFLWNTAKAVRLMASIMERKSAHRNNAYSCTNTSFSVKSHVQWMSHLSRNLNNQTKPKPQ